MMKQPTKIGKSLGGKSLILHRQHMYDVLKARYPTMYTLDGASKMLMTTSNSATNANYSDSNDSDEANSDALPSPSDTVNQIHCRWHLASSVFCANSHGSDSDGEKVD